MSNVKKIVDTLQGAISEQTKKAESTAYDTPATVRRVEGDTAWVHIPGGVDETPVKLTVAAKAGDVVQVRVTNGRAFLVGNGTAPPTDDTMAIAARTVANKAQAAAQQAQEVAEGVAGTAAQALSTANDAETLAQAAQEIANATNQHFWVHPTTGAIYITTQEQDDYLTAPSGRALLITTEGMLMQEQTTEGGATTTTLLATFTDDGTALYQDGKLAASMTQNGVVLYGADGVTAVAQFATDGVQIGQDNGSHVNISSSGQQIYAKSSNNIIKIADFGVHSSGGNTVFKYLLGRTSNPYHDDFEGHLSMTEGYDCACTGNYSHAEGQNNLSSGEASHSEGYGTKATGDSSHSEGDGSEAHGWYSHAQNNETIARSKSQTALGEYNIADTSGAANTRGTYAVIIGNGTSDTARSNALTVDWNGNSDQQGRATTEDMTAAEVSDFINGLDF